ncbi:MAG: hypothetical protein ONB52_21890 [candidate division KSB1 bacterium]|nr:hypothetical protein [candidate division KSB1 bacterium]
MTENPFVATFVPGPDRKDAELAEIMDILYKAKWRSANMGQAWARCAAWMLVAGTGYLATRIDLRRGEWREWRATVEVPVLDANGEPMVDETGTPLTVVVPNAPLNSEGEPLVRVSGPGAENIEILGPPHRERTGDIVVDVYSPLEVRGEWSAKPWHEQRIHMVRSYLTVEDVYERWGVEVEPDYRGDSLSSLAGYAERVLFGTGFYGSASAQDGLSSVGPGSGPVEWVAVQTLWMAPFKGVPEMEEGPDHPGGRLLVCTKDRVLYDGPRPFPLKYTSPIHQFRFLDLPGRPAGSTLLEAMVSPQKAYNTGWAQILQHRSLVSNPQRVVDLNSGLDPDNIDNQPGRVYAARSRPGVDPLAWVRPGDMGTDVWRAQAALADELAYLGSIQGTENIDIARDASGELVRELRFNDDRIFGPTMRAAAEELGRMIEDWLVMLPVIYDQETIIKYTGEDNIGRTILLMPEILKGGKIDVAPDLESMLPEGRGERRSRIYRLWLDGAFGPPLSPEARRKLYELSNFPHLSRTAKPGGVHWTTAEQELGDLLHGVDVPVFDFYDHVVHLTVLEEFMARREFLRLAPEIQERFFKHREAHLAYVRAQQEAQLAALQAMQADQGQRAGSQRGLAPDTLPWEQPPTPPTGVPAGAYPTAVGA